MLVSQQLRRTITLHIINLQGNKLAVGTYIINSAGKYTCIASLESGSEQGHNYYR